MSIWYSLTTALDNLRINKLRSSLTMLGVIIGVMSVIIMVAIVQGASDRVTKEFERLGSSLIFVAYDPSQKDRQQTTRRIEGLTMADVHAILERGNLVQDLSAELPFNQGVEAKVGSRTLDVTPNGVQPAYARLRNVNVARGRFLSEEDMDSWAKVCVIGDKVRTELFKDQDPIGHDIDIRGTSVRVVGVLAQKGRSMEGDTDKSIFVPLTTMQKRFLGRDTVGVIWAVPKDPTKVNETMDQIWQLLMRRYDNLPGFVIDSQENILNSINKILAVFGIVLGSIAGLALLVGGIGIMNIMLVSVTERTREIGIRKAVGAKRRDIMIQFLIESATVSGVGGLIGIAGGAGVAYSIGYITSFMPSLSDPNSGAKGIAISLPIGVSIGAFVFSAFVGIFFGMYPAMRASALNPIEALRHE